jgi:Zn-finger nucleic acid-binding protein
MGMKHVITDMKTGKILKMEDVPADVDLEAYLKQQVHDCPECRAAWDRGERPKIVTRAELDNELRAARRQRVSLRRPRWRTLKRHAR